MEADSELGLEHFVLVLIFSCQFNFIDDKHLFRVSQFCLKYHSSINFWTLFYSLDFNFLSVIQIGKSVLCFT